MSPLFAALPPADLPTVAYVPSALHSVELLAASKAGTHTVRAGDTVYDIAAQHRVPVREIVRVNGLKDNGRWIMPGDTLVIPGKGADTKAAKSTSGKGAAASSTKKSSGTKSSTTGGGTVTVRAGDTLSGLALRHGTSISAIASANGIRSGSFIYPGQKLTIPGAKSESGKGTSAGQSSYAGKKASGTSSSTQKGGTITVRAGDTLSDLAVRHGTTISAIASANGIRSGSFIYPGQKLTIPGAKGESGKGTSAKAGSSRKASSSTQVSKGGAITVRAGDTLSDLALRHRTTVSAIRSANGLSAGAFIYPGQKLTIPGSSSGSTKAEAREDNRASRGSGSTTRRDQPWDASNIGSHKAGEYVQDTFLHYRYSNATARAAAANRDYLATVGVPSREEMKQLIVAASKRHGVDSRLMLALSFQESGWNHASVSPANAIGAMQVIPSSGRWASNLAGRSLNLLDPADNAEAGVVIMKSLLAQADNRDQAIGAYYQGLAGVRNHGMFPDTRRYVANIKHHMKNV
ncbi:LysM peptidoglycan-binding domain-containing protein [Ornithinimicrobium panacihumi]|uniref:LysM peptidoglycan-binding domain-containing protein n=1 Tax=Ornithinimicrobium panacihumi TaxID=2008449 RepID=UPI003F8ACBC6